LTNPTLTALTKMHTRTGKIGDKSISLEWDYKHISNAANAYLSNFVESY